jgi:hypothetical protein
MTLKTGYYRGGRRACALLLVLAAAGLVLRPGPASAFFPTSLFTVFGLLGTSHQKMTEKSVEELDAEFFGITKLTKPMKKAIEQIADANVEVDDDQTSSAKHFDGENFGGGQLFITTLNRPQIKPALQNDNAATARHHLGQALHTLQDFYAHSSWIEMGGGLHPALGVPGATISGAGPTEPTCRDCTLLPAPFCPLCSTNITTPRLTSGYYAGEDRVKPFAAKCSHGGPFDGSVTGAGLGINKDSSDCFFSPHASLHSGAAGAAREATKKFIRELKAELTPRELKLLLGVGPNLAMAIDTTGSMGPIIAAVRSSAIGIVNARLGTDEEPSKYVLTPFNDPSVGPTRVTTDPDVFKGSIGGLFASGGGDCPELAMTGMLQALSASDEGGDLFMFTDASSKDGGLAGAVASLAASKEIKVYPITFGSCSPIDPGYVRIAEESGGQVFQLFFSEAGRITQLADFLVRSNAVNVASVALTLPGTPLSLDVPIDSTLTRATFSVTGTTGVVLRRPDGSTVQATDPGVTFVPLSTAAIYSVTGPAPGAWRVELSGSGPVSLHVTGESGLDLDSFRFVEQRGRPGHEGFFPVAGLPAAGAANTVVAVMSGAFASVGFELRARDGSPLQTLSLVNGPGQDANEFSGSISLPDTKFLVYAAGLDGAGYPFQRLVPASVQPQTVRIVPPAARTLVPGTTFTYTFQVQNVGAAADTYRFLASDDRGFVRTVTPAVFTLAGGGSQSVAVQLQVPATATPGTSDTLTATVESTVGSGARNFAVVVSSIGPEGDVTPPVIASFTASPTQLWPPNHKLRPISLTLDVSDDRDPSPACQVSGVTSNEPAGDAPDWVIGPGPLQVSLRAERDGGGAGRVYTIEVTCTDAAGNASQASATVTVPHDQGH